jgi:hypothetical protein
VREATNKIPGPGIMPNIKIVDASNSEASRVMILATITYPKDLSQHLMLRQGPTK